MTLGECPRDCLRYWRGGRRRQGKGMREEGHRILRKKLSDPAPYQRRWNAHGEGPQVGGEGRSKPSALRRLSHLFFRATKRAAGREAIRMADLLGSRLQEWLLGRRGGGDRKAPGMRNGVLDVVFRKTKRAR